MFSLPPLSHHVIPLDIIKDPRTAVTQLVRLPNSLPDRTTGDKASLFVFEAWYTRCWSKISRADSQGADGTPTSLICAKVRSCSYDILHAYIYLHSVSRMRWDSWVRWSPWAFTYDIICHPPMMKRHSAISESRANRWFFTSCPYSGIKCKKVL